MLINHAPVGSAAAIREDDCRAGQESGDPARAAAAILKIAGADDAPLHLLLGEDALHYAMRKMGQMTTEIGDWAGLSTSIGFPKT